VALLQVLGSQSDLLQLESDQQAEIAGIQEGVQQAAEQAATFVKQIVELEQQLERAQQEERRENFGMTTLGSMQEAMGYCLPASGPLSPAPLLAPLPAPREFE